MSNLDLTQYLVTEFTETSLALRKLANAEFSVNEIKHITEALNDVAEVKPLYISSLRNTMVIRAVICMFKNAQCFNSAMTDQTMSNEIKKNGFIISGFHYDNIAEACTLHFVTPLFYQFSDEEMVSLCAEMYRKGAISVFNHRLDRTSALRHRLFSFEILEDRTFKEPIFRLSCTFKTDDNGKIAIEEVLKKYSKTPTDLPQECYKSCLIGKYDTPFACTLRTVRDNKSFTSSEVTQICSWLHSLGAVSVFADVSSAFSTSEYPTVCNSIGCSFDYDDKFEEKLGEFIRYHHGMTPPASIQFLPPFHLRLNSKENSFMIFGNNTTELTCYEKFCFLITMLQLGATEVETDKQFVKCIFDDLEARTQAAVMLLS